MAVAILALIVTLWLSGGQYIESGTSRIIGVVIVARELVAGA